MAPSDTRKRSFGATFGRDEPASATTTTTTTQEDESTEMKLALLASLVPDPHTSFEVLMNALLLANGSVEDAASILNHGTVDPPDDDDDDDETDDQLQQADPEPETAATRSTDEKSLQETSNLFQTTPSKSTDLGNSFLRSANLHQSSLASFFGQPKGRLQTTAGPQADGQALPVRKKPLTRANQTLHLYAPDDIAAHTPCSIVHNFLPPALADDLLRELLKETPSFERDEFQLFDRTVTSPHTMGFYVDHLPADPAQRTEYYYNGVRLTNIRRTPPVMLAVSSLVRQKVNEEIKKRIETHYGGRKLRFQSPDEWAPNTGFVNCYDGGRESVGYHADQLTYLGPRAVIGSLSLGVAREFRVRRVVPKAADPDAESDPAEMSEGASKSKDAEAASNPSEPAPGATIPPHMGLRSPPKITKATLATARRQRERQDAQGQIAIHLPHNSLLVMHADMQEEWKHSIAPAATIDPHPVAGNKRLNITYRHYRAHFGAQHTPRCACGIPCILRCAFKSARNRGRYMWMCETTYQPGRQGCGHFEWAEFDDDGRPPWIWEHKDGSGSAAAPATAGLSDAAPTASISRGT